MILMVAALFIAFKLLALPHRRVVAYMLLWPGTDPAPFEGDRRPDPTGARVALRGAAAMAAGLGLALTVRAVPEGVRPWLLILAALMTVHLGLFDVLAGLWRRAGIPVGRICPSPWRSKSLGEFWNRRWNMAFHDVARDRIYRPIARRWNRPVALAATFLISGFLHELVISLPAGGGWGLPTLYFAIHGLVVALEKRGWVPAHPLTAAAAVLLPLPLLFHETFRTEVILPWVS